MHGIKLCFLGFHLLVCLIQLGLNLGHVGSVLRLLLLRGFLKCFDGVAQTSGLFPKLLEFGSISGKLIVNGIQLSDKLVTLISLDLDCSFV